jgi:hypothetical protein
MSWISKKTAQSAADARDLDETRRLAYTLLSGVAYQDRVLAGSLVNALAHHQRACTAEDAMAQIRVLLENPQDDEARAWMLRHITRITSAMEE